MISRKTGYRLALWGTLIVGGLILAFGVLRMVGFSWDPFGTQRARADAYVSTDLARDLEAEGYAEQAVRTDTYHHQTLTIQTQAAQTEADLRSLPDADAPIDPARLDRLRAADRELCESSPGLCSPPDASPRR